MITLIDNGDTVAAFDWATSEIVVTVVGHEVARFYQTRRRGFMDANARVTPGDVKEIILNHFQGETCPSTT